MADQVRHIPIVYALLLMRVSLSLTAGQRLADIRTFGNIWQQLTHEADGNTLIRRGLENLGDTIRFPSPAP